MCTVQNLIRVTAEILHDTRKYETIIAYKIVIFRCCEIAEENEISPKKKWKEKFHARKATVIILLLDRVETHEEIEEIEGRRHNQAPFVVKFSYQNVHGNYVQVSN